MLYPKRPRQRKWYIPYQNSPTRPHTALQLTTLLPAILEGFGWKLGALRTENKSVGILTLPGRKITLICLLSYFVAGSYCRQLDFMCLAPASRWLVGPLQ